jgi:hypothetical protein
MLENFADAILILLAIDHFVTGFIFLFLPNLNGVLAQKIYGVRFPEGGNINLLIKPWGAFGIFGSLVGLIPVFSEQDSILILYALLILLLTRLYYRISFMVEASYVIHLSRKRNLFHSLTIVICIVAVLIKLNLVP